MKSGLKLKIAKDTAEIEEGEDTFFGKLLAGTKGKVRIKTPMGEREITKVKKLKKAKGAGL